MEIKTLHRIFDDNGKECAIGDTVLLQTNKMDEPTQAVIDNIMTNMAVFIIDDRLMGYIPMKVKARDIKSLTLYTKK